MRPWRTLSSGSVIVVGLLAAACGGDDAYRPTARPPGTRVATVTETLHGVTIADDYRWLEGADPGGGPAAGDLTNEIATWTDAEHRFTRTVLENVPGRAALEAKLSGLLDAGDVSVPLTSGNRYFYWLRHPGEPLPTVYTRDGALGADRALVRPADLDPDGRVMTRWIMPSPDGRWLAFGTQRTGEADAALRVLDVNSGAIQPLEIRGSPRSVYWLPDGSGFIYQRLVTPANPTSNVVLFHELDQDPGQDRLLFRQYTTAEDPRLASTAGPFASLSSDGRWLVAGYWTSGDSNDLFLSDFTEMRRTGQVRAPRIVTVGKPGRAVGTVVGDTLFIHTTKDAPNGRVVAVDVSNPVEARWRDIVPMRADAVIDAVVYGRGVLAVTYVKDASSVTEVFDFTGKSLGVLAQPGIGTTSLSASPDRTEGFMRFESFNRPATVYRVDLGTPSVQGRQWKSSNVPVDPESVTVERVHYRSKDGTNVSMFLLRRKDVVPNGALPTLLVGFGAFGLRMSPTLTLDWFQWFDAGGLIAIPHVRGGGEYGVRWHAAGTRERKAASFEDYIAAAEWLIANRYTTPAKLAAYGTSAGALLAGGALVSRPDLFRAAVLFDPLTDMLRYDRFLQGRGWTPEFGAPGEPKEFAWLLAYSPYHRVTRGTKYPSVFLVADEASPAVHPMHARKMTARLQAASTSDPAEQPVLLWIEKAGGRQSSDTRGLRALIDQRAFLRWQLGMN
jgi:prolyl oligopeptidase